MADCLSSLPVSYDSFGGAALLQPPCKYPLYSQETIKPFLSVYSNCVSPKSTPLLISRKRELSRVILKIKERQMATVGYLVVLLNPFTARVSYGDIKVIVTSESVDEILWCYHSNETSSAVLSRGTNYI